MDLIKKHEKTGSKNQKLAERSCAIHAQNHE